MVDSGYILPSTMIFERLREVEMVQGHERLDSIVLQFVHHVLVVLDIFIQARHVTKIWKTGNGKPVENNNNYNGDDHIFYFLHSLKCHIKKDYHRKLLGLIQFVMKCSNVVKQL